MARISSTFRSSVRDDYKCCPRPSVVLSSPDETFRRSSDYTYGYVFQCSFEFVDCSLQHALLPFEVAGVVPEVAGGPTAPISWIIDGSQTQTAPNSKTAKPHRPCWPRRRRRADSHCHTAVATPLSVHTKSPTQRTRRRASLPLTSMDPSTHGTPREMRSPTKGRYISLPKASRSTFQHLSQPHLPSF